MVRAGLVAALFGASVVAASALRNEATLQSSTQLEEWKYFPPGAKIGIVTGAPQESFAKMNYAAQTASLMFKYAQKHGYAFYVEKNLPRLANRKKYWNKVLLMHKLLREVDYLVWMDPDIVIKELEVPMEDLLKTAKCNGVDQDKWMKYLSPSQSEDTFLWLNSDRNPSHYLINANTGMVVLKRTADAFNFLTKVWEAGEDPHQFEKHHDEMHWLKSNASPDKGWPFEQGAFWDVLAAEPEKYLRKTCVAYGAHFHSVRASLYNKGVFADNWYGAPPDAIRQQAHSTLVLKKVKAEIH